MMELIGQTLTQGPPEDQVAKTMFLVGDDLIQGENFTLAQLDIPIDPNNKEEDRKQIFFILNNILDYPSSQLASLHRDCDRIGNYDIDVKFQEENGVYDHDSHILCSCCGFRKQEVTVSTCTSSEYIKIIGLPTLLYFSVIKHVAVLLLISTVVFSGYSFVTNILLSPGLCADGIDCIVRSISLSAKRLSTIDASEQQYLIQSWLGLGNVVLLGCYFFFMTYRLRKLQVECELEKSISDFSIMVEYLPAHITQQRFQIILNQYYEQLYKDKTKDPPRPFEIVTFNVAEPFYMNTKTIKDKQFLDFKDQLQQKKQLFRSWITQRIDNKQSQFIMPKEQREQVYVQFNKIKDNVINKTHQILTQVSKQYQVKFNQKETKTVFVTFRYQMAAYTIIQKNQNHYSSKIRDFLKSISINQRLNNPQLEGAVISKAPQPEDIIWSNVGVPEWLIYWKKFLTFSVTAVILAISFGIMYGFSLLQEMYQSDQIISFAISLVILITNSVLEYFIKLLSFYQKNFTKTNYETSFGIKVVIAQVINAVVFTFICNYIIRVGGLYETGGLTEDVFFLALSGGLVTPVLRFFNFGYWIKRILLFWKDRPHQKLKQDQKDLNNNFQGTKFDLASGYVYLLKMYIFTSFYISLQPIIPVIGLIGLLLMYWGEKYNLLQRSVRPPNGSDILNNFMNQILYFSPVFFSLGTLTWAVFIPNSRPYSTLIPGLISIGVSVIFFLMPLDTIFGWVVEEQRLDYIYQEERIYFTTEYDRRNPATSEASIRNFQQFLMKQQIKAQKKKDDFSLKLLFDITNIQAKQQVINKPSGKRSGEYQRKNRHRGNEFQDQNNPLFLAIAQSHLAQKDTTSFIQKILSTHLNNVLLNGFNLFPSNNNISAQNIDDNKSAISNRSKKSNYPQKVLDPFSYFQQVIDTNPLDENSPDPAIKRIQSTPFKSDQDSNIAINIKNHQQSSHYLNPKNQDRQ